MPVLSREKRFFRVVFKKKIFKILKSGRKLRPEKKVKPKPSKDESLKFSSGACHESFETCYSRRTCRNHTCAGNLENQVGLSYMRKFSESGLAGIILASAKSKCVKGCPEIIVFLCYFIKMLFFRVPVTLLACGSADNAPAPGHLGEFLHIR